MYRKVDYYITTFILMLSLLTFSQCAHEEPNIETISIASIANDTIYAGKVYQLEVNMTPSVSDPRLSWSISDAHIASIEYGGVLKPIRGGELTVFVTSLQSGGKKVHASRTFTILSSGVYLKDRTIALNPQDSKSLEYEFLPENFKPKESIIWTSSDPGIATVDDEGTVTGVQFGRTVIKAKIGNPLSGFYSEDSCIVSVQSFRDPIYTYEDHVLTFEQEAPGILPMYARDMPYFKKMIVKGPINGDDLLFILSKKERIESLDLGGTYVLKGGQEFVVKNYMWGFLMSEEHYNVDDNYVPGAYFEKMEIKKLVVPQKLTSPFSFGHEFVLDSLTFPESYDTVNIIECNVNDVKFPSKMKALLCNVEGLKTHEEVLPYVAIFNKPLELPNTLETLHMIAIVKEDLVVPSTVKDVRLSYKFKTLTFEPNTSVKLDERLIPVFKKLKEGRNAMMPLEINKLVLPEGLKTIGNKAFAANLPHSDWLFSDNELRDVEPRLIHTIVFPSTLKTIEFLAFANCTFGEPIYLPEGLEEIQYSAFFGAKMKEVHIPASIKSIGDQAFAMCPELEDVYMSSTNPPAISSSVFQRTRKMGTMYRLHIPSGTKTAYIEAGYEDSFFEIVEE